MSLGVIRCWCVQWPGEPPRGGSVRRFDVVVLSVYLCIMVQTCRCEPEPQDRLRQLLEPELFKALADPNRATLIVRLGGKGGPVTVTEASDCCPVDVSVVSRHLRTLRSAGIVTATKEGREVRYRVEHRALAARLREIADALEQCCSPESC